MCATQWAALFGSCTNQGDGATATFFVLVPPAPGAPQSWEATLTFAEDHDDGFGIAIVPAGTVTTLRRVIEWVAD